MLGTKFFPKRTYNLTISHFMLRRRWLALGKQQLTLKAESIFVKFSVILAFCCHGRYQLIHRNAKSTIEKIFFRETNFEAICANRDSINCLLKRHQISTILRRFINFIALLSYFLGNLTRTLINQVWKINSILADA